MSPHFSFSKLVDYKSSTFAAIKLPKHAAEWAASMAPPTHPVESVAVVTPVVSLHQHLGQAAGMMRLGVHGDHTPLDEALHLRLANQTSAKRGWRVGGFGIWLAEPSIVSFLFTYFTDFWLWNSHTQKENPLGRHRRQMFHFLQKTDSLIFGRGSKVKANILHHCLIVFDSVLRGRTTGVHLLLWY